MCLGAVKLFWGWAVDEMEVGRCGGPFLINQWIITRKVGSAFKMLMGEKKARLVKSQSVDVSFV